MGTCFPKSKCADLEAFGREPEQPVFRRRVPPLAAPALSQSRALDFVWLCLWHFRFRFFAWLRSCCWPLALLAVNKTRPPFLVLLLASHQRFQLRVHCLQCFAKYSSRIFYLFEEALRGSFEMANSAAPRHEQVL